jgi:DNA-directed RNA polymerase specialized sigma24 family protein
MTAAEPGDVAGRSNSVSRPAVTRAEPVSASAARAADAAVTAMYAAHYRSLVGLAVLLVRDGNADTAQQVVQDSFVALHRNWRGLADRNGSGNQDGSGDQDDNGDRALLYLWQFVVNHSRSAGRHPAPAHGPGETLVDAAGPDGALAPGAVLAAMHALPPRQRESVVLQHYAGLSAAQTAQMLGISAGAVQRHTARAMSSLNGVLDRAP